MKNIKKKIWRFLKSEEGPTAVEYAVMVALIIVVAFGAIQFLGLGTSSTFKSIADPLSPKSSPKVME